MPIFTRLTQRTTDGVKTTYTLGTTTAVITVLISGFAAAGTLFGNFLLNVGIHFHWW
jgi:hypothetical protein